jgi:hypothetical protein
VSVQHSFGDGTAAGCTYWSNSAGSPPSVFTVNSPDCNGGSTGGGGGGSANPPNDDDNDYPGGGGGTTLPPGDSDLDTLTPADCVENIDCEECNLTGDINNDCTVTYDELHFSSFLNQLDRSERRFLKNNSSLYESIFTYLSQNNQSPESHAYAEEAIEAFINDGEVDYEDPLENYNFHAETTEILAFEQGYRGNMSSTERALFEGLSRFKQLDYLHSGYLAQEYALIYFEETTMVQYNGLGDAYRHALWNALGAAKLGQALIKQLTDAHEDKPFEYPQQYKEKNMDLFNNQVGRNIGSESSFMLMMKIKFSLQRGELRYLSNTNPRATTNSQLIPTNQ